MWKKPFVTLVCLSILLSLFALQGCEDTITPAVEESVRLAGLQEYTLTILEPAAGSVTPSGDVTVKQNEPLSIAATLPAGGGYVFAGWQTVTAVGTVSFANAIALSTTVKVDGGNATIQPLVTNTPRNLTITNNGHGTTSPAGTVVVADGVAFSIHATAAVTYIFNGWTKTGGSGVVQFDDPSSANTTVTVTGGDATILASFRKEVFNFSVSGTCGGFTESTVYPENGIDAYLNGSYLYVIGTTTNTGGNGVVRRFNISNPISPTTSASDYVYTNGGPTAVVGDGTYLFAGTSSNLYRFTLSTFGPSQTPVTPSTAVPITDLACSPAVDNLVWAITNDPTFPVHARIKSNLSIDTYGISDIDGYTFNYIEIGPNDLLAVQGEDQQRLSAYGVDGISGATAWTTPDSYVDVDSGADMYPASASRVAIHPSGDMAAVCTYEDETGDIQFKTYDVSVWEDIYWLDGSVDIPATGLFIAMSDNYAFVSAVEAGVARIYAIDITSWADPTVVRNYQLTGYDQVGAIALSADGNYLYVIAKNSTANKATLVVLQMLKT